MKNLFLNILKYALRQMARLTIWRFKPDIIAITGSVGKTSAKEAIYAVLSTRGRNNKRVRRTMGNLNNELGMPLTILGDFSNEELKIVSRQTQTDADFTQTNAEKKGKRIIKIIKLIFFWKKIILFSFIRLFNPLKSAYPEVLILEYGADRSGDIKYLLEIAKPKIAIITAIGETPVHIEFYENAQAVVKEKARLIENLFVSNFVILNFDDEMAMNMKEKTRAKIITFGFNEGADIKISNFENKIGDNGIIGIAFKIEYGGSFVPVILKNVFGRAQAYAMAVGTAIGIIYGMNLVEIAEAISMNYKPAERRMNLIKGIKNSFIIDDSYNASPLSMKQALETLQDLKVERKVAVLGDMLELGEYSQKAHERIGELAGKTVNFLVTVGQNGKIIALAAKKIGLAEEKILSFNKAEEVIEVVKNNIKKGDLILIKASRGIGLDKIVDSLNV